MARKQGKDLKRVGAGCLVLFALPFLGVGGFMTYRFVSGIVTWNSAAHWAETTADLDKLVLKRNKGDGGATYRIEAEYRYQYNGRDYTGHRVGLFSGADNVSNYHQRLHAKLESLRNRQQPVPCYVNPANPSQSLLDRKMRVGLLTFHIPFVLCFTGAGVGMIAAAVRQVRRNSAESRLVKLHPQEPWRWRADWASGVIPALGPASGGYWVAAAVFWNLVCGAVLLVAFAEGSVDWKLMLTLAGLNAIGLAIAAYAALLAARGVRFGASKLELADTPGVIGGRLAGVVWIPARVAPAQGFHVTLVCQRIQRNSDRNASVAVNLWEQERRITQTLRGDSRGRTAVPIAFTIPSTATATDTRAGCPVRWRLRVHAKLPGPDYRAEFELPVCLTEDSQDGVVADDAPLSEYEAELSLADQLSEEGMLLEESSGGDQWRLTAPPFRRPWVGLVILLAAIAASCVTGGLLNAALGHMGFWQVLLSFTFVFFAVFALISLGLWLTTLEMFLSSSQLWINGDRWTLRSGWYGIRRTHRFSADQIKSIALKERMNSTDSRGSQSWKDVRFKLRGGESLTLACYVRNPRTAEALRDALHRIAGLDRKGRPGKDKEDRQWDRLMDLPSED